MSEQEYHYETKNIDGFLSQLTRYVRNGQCFYYGRFLVPKHKDPRKICEKCIEKYDIAKSVWQRQSRYLDEKARIHLLLHGRLFVILLSKGVHKEFYADHGFENVKRRDGSVVRVAKPLPDIRLNALYAFGYTIRFNTRRTEPKFFVRLDEDTTRRVEAQMLRICVWDAYRKREVMEREFKRLPFQPYEPVYETLHGIFVKVNRARRRRGFEELQLDCVPNKRRLGTVFVERDESDQAA